MSRTLILFGATFLVMVFHAVAIFSNLPSQFWFVPFNEAFEIAVLEAFLSVMLGGYLFIRLLVMIHDRPRSLRFWEDEGSVDY